MSQGSLRSTNVDQRTPTKSRAVTEKQVVADAHALFTFLQEAERLKSKPVKSIDEYTRGKRGVVMFASLPQHPAIAVGSGPALEDPASPALVIDKVAPEPPPSPPTLLQGLIDGKPSDPEHPPRLVLPETDAAGGPVPAELTAKRRDAFDRWLATWHPWAETERRDAPVRALHAELFRLHNAVADSPETLEAVIGVGLFAWKGESAAVKRHLLTIPATIEYERRNARITVRPNAEDSTVAAEFDMIAPGDRPAAFDSSALEQTAREHRAHILDRGETGELVEIALNSLMPEGRYLDDDRIPVPGRIPTAAFAPAVIVRERAGNALMRVFGTIADSIARTRSVPDGIALLVDANRVPEHLATNRPGAIFRCERTGDAFLPMPVNARQGAVVQYVDAHAQTLVQGPPGTGKTHVTAVLVSHLLAQGKRVLVTAQTQQALREVRDKLPRSIRPLAVSALGSGSSDLSELRLAVQTLQAGDRPGAGVHPDQVGRKQLTRLDELAEERATMLSTLVDAREQETRPLTIGDRTGLLGDIIIEHLRERSRFEWILEYMLQQTASACGPRQPRLDHDVCARWLADLRDDAHRAAVERVPTVLPAIDDLPDAEDVAAHVRTHREAVALLGGRAESDLHPVTVRLAAESPRTRAAVRDLVHRTAQRIARALGTTDARLRSAVDDVLDRRAPHWHAHLADLDARLAEASTAADQLGRTTDVTIAPAATDDDLVHLANRFRNHLGQGGTVKIGADGLASFTLFGPKEVRAARPFLERVRVNGRQPLTLELVDAFLAHERMRYLLDALDALATPAMFPGNPASVFERLAWHRERARALAEALQLGETVRECERVLAKRLIALPVWRSPRDVDGLLGALDAADALTTIRAARNELDMLEELLREQATRTSAPDLDRLRIAVSEHDDAAYAQICDELAQHARVVTRQQRIDSVTKQMRCLVPRLVDAILRDPHGDEWTVRVPELAAAVEWATDEQAIRAALEGDLDRETAFERVAAIERMMRAQVEALAAERAWSHATLPSRLNGETKAMLQSYVQHTHRLGKGTGKYAAASRAAIRETLRACRAAVPVWIMPLREVAERLPIEPDSFDVVIVDEASQASSTAVFLQYLAPNVVVVGDDKQVSPSAPLVEEQQFHDLADRLLDGVQFKSHWRDIKRSYFDESAMRFTQSRIALTEHRRCVPEIIEFSNRIAYRKEGIPLSPVRQVGSDRLPPLRRVHVTGGADRDGVNVREAEALIAQVVACANDPAYAGLTFGVIALKSGGQAEYIEKRLLDELDTEEWTRRSLRCGSSAEFQGSERNVVFLSLVAVPEEGKLLYGVTKVDHVQRFNVAVSRAQDQVWLFHSVTPDRLRGGDDMRSALVRYFIEAEAPETTSAEDEDGSRLVSETLPDPAYPSLFAQRVSNALTRHGLRVEPMTSLAERTVDLVATGPSGRLVVAADGARWGGADEYADELRHQLHLRSAGWPYVRVGEAEWLLDPAEAEAQLLAAVDESGILRVPERPEPQVVLTPVPAEDATPAGAELAAPEEAEAHPAQAATVPKRVPDETPEPAEGSIPDNDQSDVAAEQPGTADLTASNASSAEEWDLSAPPIRTADSAGATHRSAGSASALTEMVEPAAHPEGRLDTAEELRRPTDDRLDDLWPTESRKGIPYHESVPAAPMPIPQLRQVTSFRPPERSMAVPAAPASSSPVLHGTPLRPTSSRGRLAANIARTSNPASMFGVELIPYEMFRGIAPRIDAAAEERVIEFITAIVMAEGPVTGTRLAAAYAAASGDREDRAFLRRFAQILDMTVRRRRGKVNAEQPLGEDVHGATYRIRDRPLGDPRELGPRRLADLPPIELANLIIRLTDRIPWENEEALVRAALGCLGLAGASDEDEERIVDCISLARRLMQARRL